MFKLRGSSGLVLAALIGSMVVGSTAARGGYVVTVLADNPLGYWRLGESPAATIAVDISSVANDGTYFGGPTLGVQGLINDPDTAADFRGVSGVSIAHSSAYDRVDQAFTIEAWIKPTGLTPSATRIFDNVQAGAPNGYGLAVSDDNLQFYGSTNAVIDYSFNLNHTYHVVITSDGNGVGKGYVDGLLIGTVAYSSSLPYTGTVHIGADSDGGSRFNGTIDEVALYGTALSASQVRAHYRAGIAAVPEPSSLMLAGLGLLGSVGYARWRWVRSGVMARG